ncbi:MAG: AIR synthase-related protein, partial [Candidatus Brocadiia bacterium]
VRACHGLSEGGLGVAAAEMAFAGQVGAHLSLEAVPWSGPDEHRRDAVVLFSESNSRFLMEVHPDNAQAFEQALEGCPCACIGETDAGDALTVSGPSGEVLLNAPLARLKAAWQTPLLPH